jgi:hypothetical protein
MFVVNIITFSFPLDIQEPVSVQGSFDHFNHIGARNCDREILAVMNHDRQRGSLHAISLSVHSVFLFLAR